MHAAFRRHCRSFLHSRRQGGQTFHRGRGRQNQPHRGAPGRRRRRGRAHDVRPRARPHRRHARQTRIHPRLPHQPHRRGIRKTALRTGALLHRADRPAGARRPQTLRPARRHRHRGIHSPDLLLHHVEEAGRGRGRAGARRQSRQRRLHEEAGGRPPPGADDGGHWPPHGQARAGAHHRYEPAAGLRRGQRARSDGGLADAAKRRARPISPSSPSSWPRA